MKPLSRYERRLMETQLRTPSAYRRIMDALSRDAGTKTSLAIVAALCLTALVMVSQGVFAAAEYLKGM